MSIHPSFMTLDRAALGDVDAEVKAHLEGCAACRDHVAKSSVAPDDLALARVQRRAADASRARRPTPPWIAAAAAVVIAVSAMLFLQKPAQDTLISKGAPSVAVYVRRGDTVFLWNGKDTLRSGDMIRLRIVPEEARYVTVAGQSGESLYKGELAPPETTLPIAWRLDEKGDAERLRVGFAVSEGKEIFHVDLVLPKEPL